jgi:hypothetical protein
MGFALKTGAEFSARANSVPAIAACAARLRHLAQNLGPPAIESVKQIMMLVRVRKLEKGPGSGAELSTSRLVGR